MKACPPPSYTFQQFNDEINSFYHYLKENNYTEQKIRKILAPLHPATKAKILKERTAVAALSFLLILIVFYALTAFEATSWHVSAISRILLIKLLPLWDWTVLKNEKCLISSYNFSPSPSEATPDCALCENLNEIEVHDSISRDILKMRYIDIETPVLISSRIQNWPTSPDFIADLIRDREIANSKPCRLSTNIFNGSPTVHALLTRVDLFDRFFLHFQNCNFQAMKKFRAFTPRPSFLPHELSPVQYSWLLWNKDYDIPHFKPVELVERVTLIHQITGHTFFRLLARDNCLEECRDHNVTLSQGQSLVFTGLWNLEYKPDVHENIAVILEMH